MKVSNKIKFINPRIIGGYTVRDLATDQITIDCLNKLSKTGKTLFNWQIQEVLTNLTNPISVQEEIETILKESLSKIWDSSDITIKAEEADDHKTSIFLNSSMLVALTRKEGCLMLDITSSKEKVIGKLSEEITALFRLNQAELNNIDTGPIYMLAKTSWDTVEFNKIRNIGRPLRLSNYSTTVQKQLGFVLEELISTDPSGRLFLFNGSPGTGKTYVIRGLINELRNKIYPIVIPTDSIASLTAPDLLSKFLDAKKNLKAIADNNEEKIPLVLILEDSDDLLVQRGTDNLVFVSSLLNTSDGLIGSILNLRIICTTNAKDLEIDKALLRPGRLGAKVNIDLLEPDEANRVWESLTDTKGSYAEPTSLAQIYADKRGDKRAQPTELVSKRKIGF